jgi:excisionase family DNA binding protein
MLANHEVTGKQAGKISASDKPRARRIKDACAALGVSRSHLYNLAAKGEIRLARLGNRTLVPESEIDRLLGEAA